MEENLWWTFFETCGTYVHTGFCCVSCVHFAGHEKSALSRVKKLRQRISASFGRLCEYLYIMILSPAFGVVYAEFV